MKIVILDSKIAVIDLLRSLFLDQFEADPQQLHFEWNSIREWLSPKIPGLEGWDYSLMDWPSEIPLFDVVVNTINTSLSINPHSICAEISRHRLPWVVRIECLDRIQNGIMVGGEELGDLILTKNAIYLWSVQPDKLPKLSIDISN